MTMKFRLDLEDQMEGIEHVVFEAENIDQAKRKAVDYVTNYWKGNKDYFGISKYNPKTKRWSRVAQAIRGLHDSYIFRK